MAFEKREGKWRVLSKLTFCIGRVFDIWSVHEGRTCFRANFSVQIHRMDWITDKHPAATSAISLPHVSRVFHLLCLVLLGTARLALQL